jgi:hypothetical protein
MTQFTITIGNQPAMAEQTDKTSFVVRVADKALHLYIKQDNEGANHWLDASTNSETQETKEAGSAIEAYMVNRGK